MTEAFDPLKFLELAQQIAHASQGESSLRTAVGRVYYALFLVARAKTGVTDRYNVHRSVIEAVRQRTGFRSVGDQLDSLRRLRTLADYDVGVGESGEQGWLDNWARATLLAGRILPRLRAW